MLVLYHVFLIYQGYGTYDWLVYQFAKERDANAAAQTSQGVTVSATV